MRLIRYYLHIDKSGAYETGDREGLTEEQTRSLISALYEVEFCVDVDIGKIVAVNGREVS